MYMYVYPCFLDGIHTTGFALCVIVHQIPTHPSTYKPTEGEGEEAAGEGDLDPVIAGPWMLRWDIGEGGSVMILHGCVC